METSTVKRSIIFAICCLLIAPASFARQSTKARLYAERYASAQTAKRPPTVADNTYAKRCVPSCEELLALAMRSAGVGILVTFDVPDLPAESHHIIESVEKRKQIQKDRKAMIAKARERLIASMPGKHRVVRGLDYSPVVSIHVDQTAFRALLANPAVVHMSESIRVEPALRQTIPPIGADQVWASSSGMTYTVYCGYLWRSDVPPAAIAGKNNLR